MKKLMVTLLFLAAMSSFAMAQDFIGIFTDEVGTACDAEFDTPFTDLTVYVMAYIPSFPDGITAAEFSVAGFPEDMGFPFGDSSMDFTSPLIIGDFETGFSIAWDAPQGAGTGLALIGTGEIKAYNYEGAVWVGPDHLVQIIPANDSGELVTVDDAYNIIDAQAGLFWWNCTDPDACVCFEGTATEDSNWSSVKTLF